VGEPEKQWRWLVDCTAQLGAAVWIRGPDGRLLYLNRRAEVVLGLSAGELRGLPCHRIAGCDHDGRPFCAPECPVLSLARRGAEIPPFDLRVGHAARWLRVFILTFAAGDRDPYLVHCAQQIDAEHRSLDFLRRIAAHSGHVVPCSSEVVAAGEPAPQGMPTRITARECEILGLLAEDRNLHDIAATLYVSHVTIRNHVQHILAKLGVHSILEAVALYLVTGGDTAQTTKSAPKASRSP